VRNANARRRFVVMWQAVEDDIRADVAEHYAPAGLENAVASVLSGRKAGSLSIEDLEHFDQFHVLGKDATLRLAQRVGVESTMHVLDVGSGLGGPARFLAQTFGCRVTGVDLTENYVETARFLSELTGLHDRVSFRQG